MKLWRAVFSVFALLVMAAGAAGTTWRVGPGREYARISEVAERLSPGDVVELYGDIEDSIALSQGGTTASPITIRGIPSTENGRIVRPRITLLGTNGVGIMVQGDHVALEGLDLTAADDNVRYAVRFEGAGFTMRNCRVHHSRAGVVSLAARGDALIEFSQFDANGSLRRGSLYLCSLTPGATLVVRHCLFRDDLDGAFIESRFPRTVIRYNWFENQFASAVRIFNEHSSMGEPSPAESALRPMHADIVGNVFVQGWSPGAQQDILQLGGSDPSSAGTEGDFNIAHNLFLLTRAEGVAVHVLGNVENVRLYNNVFLEYGVDSSLMYRWGGAFESPASDSFRMLFGRSEPTVSGAGNWVSTRTVGVVPGVTGTLVGTNPQFVDLVDFDLRPTADSPLAGAGAPPGRGAVGELAPRFEPQRGVSTALEGTPRTSADGLSVGPFEPGR